MSSTATFAVGAGSGLALWYLTNSMRTPPAASRAISPTASAPPTAPRNCAVHIDATGLLVEGVRVGMDEALRRCEDAGRASISTTKDAPAATCVALVSALEAATIPIAPNTDHNLPGMPRNGGDTFSMFTLGLYPEGPGKHKQLYWFRAAPPTTWEDARDRLVATGFIDLTSAKFGPAFGTWALTTEPRFFNERKAQPLPPASARNEESGDREPARRRTRRGGKGQPRYTTEGRRILRDGEPIVLVERVDLGDHRFALSPYETDQFVRRMTKLLNGGAR